MTAPDPETLLQQAMRAQVGGPKIGAADASGARVPPTAAPTAPQRWERFTTVQILLMAAIVGLIVGMVSGLAVLALR